jgi:hypothetical protein
MNDGSWNGVLLAPQKGHVSMPIIGGLHKGDVRLKSHEIPVTFLDGSLGLARAEGNNAAWTCCCGASIPLVGRSYFQFGHECHSICPSCQRKYRVLSDARKRAAEVRELDWTIAGEERRRL